MSSEYVSPEHDLPDDVEQAIKSLIFSSGQLHPVRHAIFQREERALRAAIRRAIYDNKAEVFTKAEKVIGEFMERNKDLRERCERLRMELTWWLKPENMGETYLPERFLKEGDLDDNLKLPVATADPNGD